MIGKSAHLLRVALLDALACPPISHSCMLSLTSPLPVSLRTANEVCFLGQTFVSSVEPHTPPLCFLTPHSFPTPIYRLEITKAATEYRRVLPRGYAMGGMGGG